MVLLLTYGFRDPGPALPWGRPHFGTHTICKSGGHTTQRMALWLYFLYEICGELLESYSFSWVVLTSPWGLRGPALCIWFQRSWSSSALGEATHTHTRYPDHMETPFQGQCPIHVVFEPWVYNLISHVSWIATHALRNNHIIKLRVAPIPLMY